MPAPLPPVTRARTGAAVVPPLPALALVALAGAGALLATRGTARPVLGGVLVSCGAGIVAAAGWALAAVDGVTAAGPAVALAAGIALAVVGALTVGRGRAWPGLGARYDRARGRPRPGRLRTSSCGTPSTGARIRRRTDDLLILWPAGAAKWMKTPKTAMILPCRS